MILGSRGRRSLGARLISGVAMFCTLAGQIRMAYALPGKAAAGKASPNTSAIAAMPVGTTGQASPGKLPTDSARALSRRLNPSSIVPLQGPVDVAAVDRLFDERSGTGLETGGRAAKFRIDLASPAYLDAIAVFGDANGVLSIEGDGPKGTASVMERANLSRSNGAGIAIRSLPAPL